MSQAETTPQLQENQQQGFFEPKDKEVQQQEQQTQSSSGEALPEQPVSRYEAPKDTVETTGSQENVPPSEANRAYENLGYSTTSEPNPERKEGGIPSPSPTELQGTLESSREEAKRAEEEAKPESKPQETESAPLTQTPEQIDTQQLSEETKKEEIGQEAQPESKPQETESTPLAQSTGTIPEQIDTQQPSQEEVTKKEEFGQEVKSQETGSDAPLTQSTEQFDTQQPSQEEVTKKEEFGQAEVENKPQEMESAQSTRGEVTKKKGRKKKRMHPFLWQWETLWAPTTDLKETDSHLIVTAELPGVKKEDVIIEFFKGQLTIRGERKERKEQKSGKFIHSEIMYGSFERTVRVPKNVNEDEINAKFENGVLQIFLPKKSEPAKKPILIE
jgi:HSP20 family protein